MNPALRLSCAVLAPLAVLLLYGRDDEDWMRAAAGTGSFQRMTACHALGQVDEERLAEALPLLLRAKLRQEQPEVRNAASSALRALRPRLVELLLRGPEAGGTAWASLRRYALAAAGGDPDELIQLMQVLLQTRDEGERERIRAAFADLGPEAGAALARLRSHPNPKVREAVERGSPAEALGDESR